MILNPWDVQSKRISTTDGTLPAIYAGRSAWMGSEMYIIKKKPDVVNSSGGVSQVHLTPITGRGAENGNQSQRLQVATGGISEEERRSMGDRKRTDASDPLAAEVRCAEHDARPDMCPDSDYEVRRLMPIECARLMGFPPDWCDDVPHTDSAEYKLWGNGIALPTIIPMMKAMGAVIEDEISREICEPRICTACGKEMWQGYVIHDGDEYYCSDECLHEYYSDEEYDQLRQEDEGYWTQWD